MDNLLSNIKIEVPQGVYLKDPESSALGKRIVEHSIIMIEAIGFENFTFKKLGQAIGSNESSIYRYFDSKHKLLVYLTAWYWAWLEYQLVLETYSITDIQLKLEKAIAIVAQTTTQDTTYGHINEVLLYKIIVHENSKSYLTKSVDKQNKDGLFFSYKRVVKRLSQIMADYNPTYPYPLSLASTVVQGALHQHFMQSHFSSITSCNKQNTPLCFFTDLTFKTLSYGK